MTPAQFKAATGAEEKWASPIITAMRAYGINTPIRQAHFLAQAGHESGGFKHLVENLNYSADGLMKTWPSRFNAESAARMARKPELIANHVYAGRMGNVQPGDGWKYRGRGVFQLTGRSNYARAGKSMGMPLEREPERLESLEAASMSAAWYWFDKGLSTLADNDNIVEITKSINGGFNGLQDRRNRFERAKRALGL